MSDETEDFGSDWDLGEVLAERVQPTDTVDVYLNEQASYTKVGLVKTLSKETDADKITAIQEAIDEVDALLEASKYVIHLTAVPSRMREDINSKALSEFPFKPNVMGYDDPEQARNRQARENELIWHAQILDVVNPQGKHRRNWSVEQIAAFSASLPTAVQKAVDAKIRELTLSAEEYTIRSKNPDF